MNEAAFSSAKIDSRHDVPLAISTPEEATNISTCFK
jgi:hypothetical protein